VNTRQETQNERVLGRAERGRACAGVLSGREAGRLRSAGDLLGVAGTALGGSARRARGAGGRQIPAAGVSKATKTTRSRAIW
jgi:hypothetical protein